MGTWQQSPCMCVCVCVCERVCIYQYEPKSIRVSNISNISNISIISIISHFITCSTFEKSLWSTNFLLYRNKQTKPNKTKKKDKRVYDGSHQYKFQRDKK